MGVDEHINASVSGDTEVTAHDATAKVLVVRAREDLEMARQVERALGR